MSVTPDFVGQRYKDTNTGNIWIANSTTPGDWTLEVQNMQTVWNPTNLKLGELIGFFNYNLMPGITSIVFNQSTLLQSMDLQDLDNATQIEFPNLVSVDPSGISGSSYLSIAWCDIVTDISLPLLQSSRGGLIIKNNPQLVNLDLTSFVETINGAIEIKNNTSLAVLNCANLFPPNSTDLAFTNNALNSASVNLVLSRCVANPAYSIGSVSLNGGTNAAPSGQGVTDKNTLVGRGVVVTTN